ncbi:unnamed protein product [Vitrella brassicaformis CCMP3155]|uniref:Uncharacterized protein n=2 Tax=Vitrella brassicaformis TaxID=1169539 RepID=A0A0G4F470_VITBC|nr:unnamed protein product [Vitrella brassicaformis CCMP3155]|eukprot:CEM06828.1 unnamed protein product [Vitrella brassicaformis CCMP3155]
MDAEEESLELLQDLQASLDHYNSELKEKTDCLPPPRAALVEALCTHLDKSATELANVLHNWNQPAAAAAAPEPLAESAGGGLPRSRSRGDSAFPDDSTVPNFGSVAEMLSSAEGMVMADEGGRQDVGGASQAPAPPQTPPDEVLARLPDHVRRRWDMWTGNPAAFSLQVIRQAMQRPFSNAYLSGDPSSRNTTQLILPAPNTYLSLRWHRTVSRVGLPDAPPPPAELREGYAAALIRDVVEQAVSHPDYVSQPDRYPSLQRAVALCTKSHQSDQQPK